MRSFLPKIFSLSEEEKHAELEHKMIKAEAEVGGRLFGPIPKGHQRQFFALDSHTWIWYEEWAESGRKKSVTTRYEVRPGVGIVKVQDGHPAQYISRKEAENLHQATLKYYELISASYQKIISNA